MKRRLIGIIVAILIVLTYTGCSNSNEKKDNNSKNTSSPVVTTSPQATTNPKNSSNPKETGAPKETGNPQVTDASQDLRDSKDAEGKLKAADKFSYATISEWYDWGPAITKVIFKIGTPVDQATLSDDTFKVSSVRAYNTDGTAPKAGEKTSDVETSERKILKVYSSDESGKSLADGSYITFELEVKPGVTDSSPLNYNTRTEFVNWVDTSYIIELTSNAKLTATDGTKITFEPTDKTGYVANKNMIPEGFDYSGSYKQGDVELLYASWAPKKDTKANDSTPLIVWLHGFSEGGHDASLAVYGNQIVKMASNELQSYFGDTGANLLIPQAPTFWMDYSGSGTFNFISGEFEGTSYYSEALMGLIKDYVAKHSEIDEDRIYIGGLSNGGYMTINMITLYPDYFAAAFPACASYRGSWLTEEKQSAILNMPIWLTHAKTDTTVPIYRTSYNDQTQINEVMKNDDGSEIPIDDYSNAVYNLLKKAGAKNVHYSLWDKVVDTSGQFFKEGTNEPYEYNGHFSWMYIFNNLDKDTIDGKEVTIFEWLSRQSRNNR